MKLPKAYNAADYESDIYALWEKSGVFTPDPSNAGESFSMTLPPPNANANLHLGHALDFQLKDTIGRFKRMTGHNVLLLPGSDHAGFETWYVYENKLNSEGKSRFDFSREELYKQVWDFVAGNKVNMENQIRRFGTSCDWSKNTFTLDDKIVDRAYETFKKMWDEGLIYRGERLVNYCTTHHTGFSDIEVDYEERTTPLYYMKYGPFTLATTRPETKFGDTAVAVHPDDERYKEYIDTVIEVDGLNGPFKLRVVADEYVDPEFGTGAVKITPAHDFNDYDIAERHNLEHVRVINHDGTMNRNAGKYEGLTVVEAREKVVTDLKEKGLLVKVDEDYINRVGVCYKCGTTIEPMLMKQWFVKMTPLAKQAIKRIEADEIAFYPSKKKHEILAYLSEIRDWNISRQIAWGIPIPVFQNIEDEDDWIYDTRVHEETIEVGKHKYRRDPDVFDTWWSSGQWPYATLDYPSEDSDRFYPTSLMETGVDLLRQWVSRMIILGVYITGDVPFKDVYFHGMIVDEHGAKMSKSKGNVINPMDIIDEYGADALRLGVLNGTSPGNPQPFGTPKVVGGRNFCNKVWNVARYVEGVIDGGEDRGAKPVTAADHWILSRKNETITRTTELMEAYRISEAYETVYRFVRDDFADWYIEASKKQLNPGLLVRLLEDCLRLVHPFAPFVTETIWQTLQGTETEVLMAESWPEAQKFDQKYVDEFEEIKRVITEVRYIIKALGVNKPNLYHKGAQFIDDNAAVIAAMGGVEGVTQVEQGRGMNLTSTQEEVWLDIDRRTAKSYVAKLEDDLAKQDAVIANLEHRLANKGYVSKAPKEVVEQTKQQLSEAQEHLQKIKSELDQFRTATQNL